MDSPEQPQINRKIKIWRSFNPNSVERQRLTYEKIPQEEIGGIIDRYQRFYNLPPEIAQLGHNTESFILTEEQLVQEEAYIFYENLKAIDEIASTAAGVSLNRRSIFFRSLTKMPKGVLREMRRRILSELKKAVVSDEVRETGGEFVSGGEKSFILVNRNSSMDRKEVLDHEVFHALSADSQHGWVGLSEGSRFTGLNEAATEILRITEQHPNLNILDLYKKHSAGEIKTPYTEKVKILLTVIALINVNRLDFTTQDLADHYFGIRDGVGLRGSGLTHLLSKLAGARGDEKDERDAERLLEHLK